MSRVEDKFPYDFVVPDKRGWPAGPWHSEPDCDSWQDSDTQIRCAIIRHSQLGNWCGYVQVPREHPLVGLDSTDLVRMPKGWERRKIRIDEDIGVLNLLCASMQKRPAGRRPLSVILLCHGGLSYSKNGWLGFDCAHAGDFIPGCPPECRAGIYRDIYYARLHVERLVEQLVDYQAALKAEEEEKER